MGGGLREPPPPPPWAQSKFLLKEHINAIHLNNKTHKCDHCDYSSANRTNMNSHKKIHQPDHIGKKHLCDKCSRGFRTPFKLKEHVDAVHLRLKPFGCGVGNCEWVTGFLANVGVHRRKVHGIKGGKKGRPRTMTNAPPVEDDSQDDIDEDAQRNESKCKHTVYELCQHCMIPLCRECASKILQPQGQRVPAMVLANDKFLGIHDRDH